MFFFFALFIFLELCWEQNDLFSKGTLHTQKESDVSCTTACAGGLTPNSCLLASAEANSPHTVKGPSAACAAACFAIEVCVFGIFGEPSITSS